MHAEPGVSSDAGAPSRRAADLAAWLGARSVKVDGVAPQGWSRRFAASAQVGPNLARLRVPASTPDFARQREPQERTKGTTDPLAAEQSVPERAK